MDFKNIAINTVMFSGPLEEKLQAVAIAGFKSIELWGPDLFYYPGGEQKAVELVNQSGLHVSTLQVLRDFEGLQRTLLQQKLKSVEHMLELVNSLHADLLLVCSSTLPHSSCNQQKLAGDLRLLGNLAKPLGIRIGYEALSWGTWISEYHNAWQIVEQANHPNVGLIIDSFHIYIKRTPMQFLDKIPADKIFLVQLSDYQFESGQPKEWTDKDKIVELARHHRVFPGEGCHHVEDMISQLEHNGYCGTYSFEIFNDEYFKDIPSNVAEHARCSAEWIIEQVNKIEQRETEH